jgi:DNA-directed RNA polymerase specialized sigma24 family protein
VLALAGLGLGPAEIAPRLGVTANCAKVALHRARRRLEALVHEM